MSEVKRIITYKYLNGYFTKLHPVRVSLVVSLSDPKSPISDQFCMYNVSVFYW